MALYYYSNGRTAEEVSDSDHSTVFKARPDEDLTEKKSTSNEVKEIIKKFIPPILLDLSKGKKKEGS